ncbi:MAG TPA: HAMP domain-containing sensor histidine kinase [Ktedonobacterales bacterium]|nr:HAMP domain-containing sensor histidine kinase [Ktedonobacterales bacterium]
MSLASQPFLPLTEAELAVYQTYERQRRQQLLRVMLPLSAILLGIGSVAFTLVLPTITPLNFEVWLNYGFLVLAAVSCGLGTLAVRRGRVGLATALMFAGGVSGLLLAVLVRIFEQGLDPYGLSEFVTFSAIIVLAGILGGIRAIIATTILMNLLTVAVTLLPPYPVGIYPLMQSQLNYLLPTALVFQWLVATFLMAQWLTYRRTLRTLGAAYERAQQLDRIKDQFITHVNHELRTPVMAVQSYIEYLRVARPQLSGEEMDAALERTSQAGTALVTLLENILAVRRIDGKTEAFTPTIVPLRGVVDKAMLLVDPRLGASGIRDLHLNVSENLVAWAEPVRCQQILTNLLANACKYSPPQSSIEVNAHFVAASSAPLRRVQRGRNQTPSFVEIEVRDHGLGIPPEQMSLLFNRFTRLPRDLASSVEGNGLGLYLCRVLAESMGGAIWAESTGIEGEGSTFHLRLPVPPVLN